VGDVEVTTVPPAVDKVAYKGDMPVKELIKSMLIIIIIIIY
jgi:hypothetical protein